MIDDTYAKVFKNKIEKEAQKQQKGQQQKDNNIKLDNNRPSMKEQREGRR